MRLADDAAALAKLGRAAVPATAPSAAVVPMKFRRVRAVDSLFMGRRVLRSAGPKSSAWPSAGLDEAKGQTYPRAALALSVPGGSNPRF